MFFIVVIIIGKMPLDEPLYFIIKLYDGHKNI